MFYYASLLEFHRYRTDIDKKKDEMSHFPLCFIKLFLQRLNNFFSEKWLSDSNRLIKNTFLLDVLLKLRSNLSFLSSTISQPFIYYLAKNLLNCIVETMTPSVVIKTNGNWIQKY